MSELRKDYTTPEQSKRLLELGIPIESANIVYYHTPDSLHDPYLITEKRHIENLKAGKGLPCWSVGRLIEIYLICNEVIDNVTELHHSAIKIDVREFNIVEYIICKLTNKIRKNKDFLSKLWSEDETRKSMEMLVRNN